MLIWNVAPYVVIRGQVTSPFSALPAQRIWPANETMSYDRASATCVCVCVCVCVITHIASVLRFFVNWITVVLLVLWRLTCRFSDVLGISTTRLYLGLSQPCLRRNCGAVVPRRCPLPRRWCLDSWAPVRDNRGQQSLSPPCSGSVYFRLMWNWKNRRRQRTRRSHVRFIISSGGFWP